MKKLTSVLIILITLSISAIAQKSKKDVVKAIDSKSEEYSAIAMKIWDFAEVGFQETNSSALLQETLTKSGFKVEEGVAGMPTSFIASYGQGKPVIAILGEFDALPGIAQEAVAEKKPIEGQVAGHACGHH
ncbi:MAG: amidohydrolase, partial [Cyclobacteriaceae bacterium]|nr:amidohydrolase [Cyclobacteriaceae bacterium]